MKKTLFALLLLTVFFVGINVKAKYASYKTGDFIKIEDAYYVVIEDSSENSDKLVIMAPGILSVSNPVELVETCDARPYVGSNMLATSSGTRSIVDYSEIYADDFQCIAEHAQFCTIEDEECAELYVPFESAELEEDEELTYDETRTTNIAYLFKNSIDNYFKSLLHLNNVKTRLLTADEQIAYALKQSMNIGGRFISQYGSLQENCSGGVPTKSNFKSSSRSAPVIGEDTDGEFLSGRYWVNSLKYSKTCQTAVDYISSYGYIDDEYYDEYSLIRPVIEISKKEFSFGVTTEKEGDGALEVQVANGNVKVGDFITLGNIPYIVISKSNGQVRLIATNPVTLSNMEEVYTTCDEETTDVFGCIAEHANYCETYDRNDCEILILPYNFEDYSNHYYDPTDTTNVGHYIKNDLKTAIQGQIGINVIDVDILDPDEADSLWDNPNIPIYFIPFYIGPYDEPIAREAKLRSSYMPTIMLNFNDYIDEYDDDISDYNYIVPVITVSVDDLPVEAKAGSTVTIVTEPNEGYELVELKVIDDDNNNVVYTPSELVRRERGTYTYKMPSASTHVYAKFVPIQTYNAKSLSEELTIDEGLNLLSGTAVKYRIRLNTGDTLTGIVYYDEEQNEISVPYEEENGEYTFSMPTMNVFLRAVIQYADPVYNLYGTDVTIPVQKSKEGGTLTFTVNGTKKVDKIVYKDEEGNEIHPYYSVNNGTYSVIMPANDVYVEITYVEETYTPDKEDNIPTPITRDNIIKSVSFFGIGLFIFMACVVILKKRKPRKKVLIPYDMV